jgi:N-glycosylase/DNA lyase
MEGWRFLTFPNLSLEFNLNNTFFIGQVFNWKLFGDVYAGVLDNSLLELKPVQSVIWYRFTPNVENEEQMLRDFLRLEVEIGEKYLEWSKSDKVFRQSYQKRPGVRHLRQPIYECMISFITSQNSNISRITRNLETLRVHYGNLVAVKYDVKWYSFPTPETMANASEDDLRKLGFGYRAKYIVQASRQIVEKGGLDWLQGLREMKYEDKHENLMKLCGIGPKVADCISLFCLDADEAIPVDTHVKQIAERHFMPELKKAKSLTAKLYKE